VEKTKEQRIRTEERRLNRIYKNLESQKKQVVVGLIKRAAYMRITLEDFEKDLDENGYTEKFQQGREQTPYDRKRPVAEMYTSMQALYQKAVKQLTDLLPKETTALTKSAQDDGFEDFVNDRYD
jgi:hypothetical protein